MRRFTMLASILATVFQAAGAQSTSRIRGTVRTSGDVPVPGANVFLSGSIDGALADSLGRFEFPTQRQGPQTLVVRLVGWTAKQVPVTIDSSVITINVTLAPATIELATVRIEAGAYRVDNERGATLSTIDVVTAPGSAADVYRAIQMLPGLQSVDEGTGLYVRGGDFTETRVFLNGSALLNPAQLQTPLGTFIGRIDPFQLDGIYFSSGGFGVRYGNALSAIASLRTMGMPDLSGGSVGAGIGHVAFGGAVRASEHFGARVAANYSDLRAFMRLNGSDHSYDPAPRSLDGSVSGIWKYRERGQFTLFAYADRTRLGVGLDDAAFQGLYRVRTGSDAAILSWKDTRDRLSWNGVVSFAQQKNTEHFGVYQFEHLLHDWQSAFSVDVQARPGVLLRAGAERSRLGAAYTGSLPGEREDARPGARTIIVADDEAGVRAGAFTEVDWHVSERVRFTPGVRIDRSSLTDAHTVDPRVSMAVKLPRSFAVTAAAGMYSQTPDPLLHVESVGGEAWPSMRARQLIIGLDGGNERRTVRIEAYHKEYRDLVAFTPDYRARGGGTGTARGIDVFARTAGPFSTGFRAVISAVRSRRTDPESGEMARAPFDVPLSAVLIADWRSSGFTFAIGQRWATGRPFTPINGATYDAERDVWHPVFGAPMSERLPAFRRLDLSVSRVWIGESGATTVVFASVTNFLDRDNVQRYTYSRDYTRRVPTPGIFNRSLYFGATISR